MDPQAFEKAANVVIGIVFVAILFGMFCSGLLGYTIAIWSR